MVIVAGRRPGLRGAAGAFALAARHQRGGACVRACVRACVLVRAARTSSTCERAGQAEAERRLLFVGSVANFEFLIVRQQRTFGHVGGAASRLEELRQRRQSISTLSASWRRLMRPLLHSLPASWLRLMTAPPFDACILATFCYRSSICAGGRSGHLDTTAARFQLRDSVGHLHQAQPNARRHVSRSTHSTRGHMLCINPRTGSALTATS